MQARSQRFCKIRLGHFDKRFIKSTRKKSPQGKKFSPRYSWNYILHGKFRVFFPKSEHFFQFLKKGRGGLPRLPSCMPVSVAICASVSLNITKHHWKCLNKLIWLCQGSEDVLSSYMFNKLSKMSRIINLAGFWIWHGCLCKRYTEFWICLNIAHYDSIMPEYASICLNVT